MNALQSFIIARPGGFLSEADMPALIAMDRLCQVLVRCGGCRFTCGAQDVAHLISCVEAGGDYVRDVSFPVGSIERAADWQPAPLPGLVLHRDFAMPPRVERVFESSDCGGTWDGFQVGSDADSGL